MYSENTNVAREEENNNKPGISGRRSKDIAGMGIEDLRFVLGE